MKLTTSSLKPGLNQKCIRETFTTSVPHFLFSVVIHQLHFKVSEFSWFWYEIEGHKQPPLDTWNGCKLYFCSLFLFRLSAVRKASTTRPLAACGLVRPFCLASPRSACSSSTTPSVPNNTDASRRSLQNNNRWIWKIILFLVSSDSSSTAFLIDMRKWASGGRHLSLFSYTVSFNTRVLKWSLTLGLQQRWYLRKYHDIIQLS